jgi:hypothetical protein
MKIYNILYTLGDNERQKRTSGGFLLY